MISKIKNKIDLVISISKIHYPQTRDLDSNFTYTEITYCFDLVIRNSNYKTDVIYSNMCYLSKKII